MRGELDRLVDRAEAGATVARALAARFPPAPASGRGDAGVLAAARRLGAAVVTADARLQARLVAAGVTVLAPRDRSRLELRVGLPPSARSGSPGVRTRRRTPRQPL